MIAEGLTHGMTSPPTRHDICRWTLVAFRNFPVQMIQNSWKHGEYTWFPGSVSEECPPPTKFSFLGMSASDEELQDKTAVTSDEINEDEEQI